MYKKAKAQVVIEIDPTKKYILQLPRPRRAADVKEIQHAISEWVKGDEPFFIIFGEAGDVKLTKVE